MVGGGYSGDNESDPILSEQSLAFTLKGIDCSHAYLRQRGVAVYGVPLFVKDRGGSRAHGNDERILTANLEAGATLLPRRVGRQRVRPCGLPRKLRMRPGQRPPPHRR